MTPLTDQGSGSIRQGRKNALYQLTVGADVRTVQEMLGHSSYAFTADSYISAAAAS